MALIYRSIFEVADPYGAFVDRAAGYFEEWARLKLHDSSLELPLTGKIERPDEGVEISIARAEDAGLSVFRGALFETARGDGAELETQLVAISHNEHAIAWVDLDRTALHATADADWVPSAPNSERKDRLILDLCPKTDLQLNGGPKRLPRGGKDAERLVTAKLDHLTARRGHRLPDESGESGSELSGLLVAVFLREACVAADVCD